MKSSRCWRRSIAAGADSRVATAEQTLRVLLPPFFASELFIRGSPALCRSPEIDMQIDTTIAPSIHPPTADVSILLAPTRNRRDSRAAGLFSLNLNSRVLEGACVHGRSSRQRGLQAEWHSSFTQARPFAWTSLGRGSRPGDGRAEERDRARYDVCRGARRGTRHRPGTRTVRALRRVVPLGSAGENFSVELATNDTYFLVSRRKTRKNRGQKAITHWPRAVPQTIRRTDSCYTAHPSRRWRNRQGFL